MNDAAVEGAKRFELDDVAPAADLLRRFLGFLDEGFAGLGAVAADINHDLGRGGVLLKEQTIGDVLKIGKGLALPADEAAGILSFYVEEDAVLHVVFFDGDGEAQEVEDFFESDFGFGHSWWS